LSDEAEAGWAVVVIVAMIVLLSFVTVLYPSTVVLRSVVRSGTACRIML
jgi:hypothetical protein